MFCHALHVTIGHYIFSQSNQRNQQNQLGKFKMSELSDRQRGERLRIEKPLISMISMDFYLFFFGNVCLRHCYFLIFQ